MLFGVETVLWPRAAKKSGNWHRGIVDAADRLMTRWHRGEWKELVTPHSKRASRAGIKGNRRDGGGAALPLLKLHVEERRNEMEDRVARYQFD